MTAQVASIETGDAAAIGSHPRLRRLAVLLAIGAVFEALALVGLSNQGDRRFTLKADLVSVGFLATVTVYPVMGALIVQRRPATRVAWLMIALGILIGLGLVTYAYGVVGRPVGGQPMPFTIQALVLSQLLFVPAIGGFMTWILLFFPTDHLLGSRWQAVGLLGTVSSAIYATATLFRPGQFDSTALPGVFNPLGLGGEAGQFVSTLADGANVLGLVGLVLASWSLVLRYRRADHIVAAQIRWLALVAVLAVAALGISLLPLPEAINDFMFGLGLTLTAAMPIAIGIAVTRYRLYEIDRLINRTLVYGSLTAILAGVFTAGVGLAQRMFVAVTHETSDAAVVGATLVVATLYAPLRKRLEAVVDRRFKFEQARFGAYRDELLKAMSLSQPERAAARLAKEALREMELVGCAVLARDERVVASAGLWPAQPVARVPIRHGGEILHTLVLGPRRDGARSNPQEVADLEGLAALVAAAAVPSPS